MTEKVNINELFSEIDTSFNNLDNEGSQKDDVIPDNIYNAQVIKIELLPKYKKVVWSMKILDGSYKGSNVSMWTPVTGDLAFITKSNMYYAGYPIASEKDAMLANQAYVPASTQILDRIEQMVLEMPKVRLELKTKGEYQNKRIIGKIKEETEAKPKADWKADTEAEARTDAPVSEDKVRELFK